MIEAGREEEGGDSEQQSLTSTSGRYTGLPSGVLKRTHVFWALVRLPMTLPIIHSLVLLWRYNAFLPIMPSFHSSTGRDRSVPGIVVGFSLFRCVKKRAGNRKPLDSSVPLLAAEHTEDYFLYDQQGNYFSVYRAEDGVIHYQKEDPVNRFNPPMDQSYSYDSGLYAPPCPLIVGVREAWRM